MTNEEILENYGSYVTDWYCVEAFIKDGSFYYRYEDADPVTEPGQIHHLKTVLERARGLLGQDSEEFIVGVSKF